MLQQSAASLVSAAPNSDTSLTINEFLIFKLGDEEYGIEILKVQEIRSYEVITQIANTPDFIKGVINLRGIIVPIIDMRIKFSLSNASYDQFTVVIILNVSGQVMGIVVDGVSDVLSLESNQMRPAPELGSALDTEYIMGLGTIDNRMLILIDIEKMVNSGGMGLIEQSIN
ncbi:chemotaxis protein CheW [Nitrosomonas sp.]|uniref:chemotaxis protein CheW n=1 Tax=Nitrosomonas sp. TaxID=42353 RepID=UPI0025E83398|nr:chemotaxis protein CheW [Nitrosomonas sp.]MBV6448357.1 Chemotaxis protein CheW [Nitrosomonas sp.]